MKTEEMADAVGPLSDYARRARREPCVVTVNGKPIVALMPVFVSLNTDLENIAAP